MERLNVEPNTPEWLDKRQACFCASEAPAMMNESRFMTRTELLDLKSGVKKAVNSSTQAIFDRGHESEEYARGHIEAELLEDLPPVVGVIKVNDMMLLASFDGLSDDGKTIWEHKLFNKDLAKRVVAGDLTAHYYWQLEHQMLVSNQDECIFMTSDGSIENRESMTYKSIPERREKLIAGWSQFAKDLKVHVVIEPIKKVIGSSSSFFPTLVCDTTGTSITSNADDILATVIAMAEIENDRELETDQDFADKEEFNKQVKKARADIKTAVAEQRNESFIHLCDVAKEIDTVLQKMQSLGEKQVKEKKQQIKNDIVNNADESFSQYIDEVNEQIEPFIISDILDCSMPALASAMKGKRTISSMQNAVDSELANFKAGVESRLDAIKINIESFKEVERDHLFLFNDIALLLGNNTATFDAVVNSRLTEHKAAEEKRIEAERETIRKEEQAKAQAKIEAEREAIRKEEQAKAIAEATLKEEKIEKEKPAKKQEKETEVKTLNVSMPKSLHAIFLDLLIANFEVEIEGNEVSIK